MGAVSRVVPRQQLDEVRQVFEGEDSIRTSAEASLKVLNSAINRNS